MRKIYNCFRIVEVTRTGDYKTLFHGIKKSRVLPLNKWLKAERKWVNDGVGTYYWSGFHVLKTIKDARAYLKKFKKKRNKRIIAIQAMGLRKKAHSPYPVFLASKTRILCLKNFQKN